MRELRECERCHDTFPAFHDEQRFCGRSCAALFRYYGATEVIDKVHDVAERCYRFIINAGDAKGVTPADLARYIGSAYRDLRLVEQECVNLLLTKRPDVAWLTSGEAYRFWPRRAAPPEATINRDPRAP